MWILQYVTNDKNEIGKRGKERKSRKRKRRRTTQIGCMIELEGKVGRRGKKEGNRGENNEEEREGVMRSWCSKGAKRRKAGRGKNEIN